MLQSVTTSLVWRFVDESGLGADLVSLVFRANHFPAEHQLMTDIIAGHPLVATGHQVTELTWQDQDQDLFMDLAQALWSMHDDSELHLDVQDAGFLELIQIMAAIRFGYMHSAQPLLNLPEFFTEPVDPECFDRVALPTAGGYVLAMVCDRDSTHCQVILLEDINDEHSLLGKFDKLEVELSALLPAAFAQTYVVPALLCH